MRKFLPIFFLSCFCFVTFTKAQTVTSSPSPIKANESATITFTASSASNPLYNFDGDVYMYTGVTTNKGNWQYVIQSSWLDNNPKCKMTKTGTNTWSLTMPSGPRAFYGVRDDEQVKQIALVIRDGEGNKGTPNDVFLNVTDVGLYLTISPASDQIITKGSTLNLTATATETCSQIRLLLNNNEIRKATNTKYVYYSGYPFNESGVFTLTGEATSAVYGTKSSSVKVTVLDAPVSEPRPTGTIDGINVINDNTVTFVMYAPGKNNVVLIGDFNDWTVSSSYMLKKDENYWWITINGLDPNKEYAFQYLVDGTIRIGDPYCEKILDPWNDQYIPSSTYPNLREYPSDKTNEIVSVFQTKTTPYNWQVQNFQKPRQDKLVIYELLIRDFTSESDLNGVMTKLDYLQGLGINAIELMPVQEFDGNDSWGYNPMYYFALDKAYGTKEMYKAFIDECHKRGMAVILDVVYNHATGNHPFAKLYWDSANNRPASNSPWFNVTAPHPFSVFEDFNHESALVRTFVKRNLDFLLKEYKFDGFRFDLTKGFTQKSSNESTASNYDATRIAILKDYYNRIKATDPTAYMIIEHLCEDREEKELADYGMMPWGNKNYNYCQAAMGWQSASGFGGVNGWTRNWTYNNLVGYMESHDEERLMFKAKTDGTSQIKASLDVQMQRAVLDAAFFLPIPGAKMIWQFGEVGYDYSINSAAGSSELSEGNRTYRKEIRWDYFDDPLRRNVYDTYAKLINLRKEYDATFDTPTLWSDMQIGDYDWEQGRRICLNSDDLKMVIVGNFRSDVTVTTNPNFPVGGTWYDLVTGETMDVINTSQTLNLSPNMFKVLTNKRVTSVGKIQADDLNMYVSGDLLTIDTNKDITGIKIYDLSGILRKEILNQKSISVSGLDGGCYMVSVQTDIENIVKKFVKSK